MNLSSAKEGRDIFQLLWTKVRKLAFSSCQIASDEPTTRNCSQIPGFKKISATAVRNSYQLSSALSLDVIVISISPAQSSTSTHSVALVSESAKGRQQAILGLGWDKDWSSPAPSVHAHRQSSVGKGQVMQEASTKFGQLFSLSSSSFVPCGFVIESNIKLNVQRSITKSRPMAKISFARIPTKWSINRLARISNYNRDTAG